MNKGGGKARKASWGGSRKPAANDYIEIKSTGQKPVWFHLCYCDDVNTHRGRSQS